MEKILMPKPQSYMKSNKNLKNLILKMMMMFVKKLI